jgi:rod shape determining protein RodA
MILNTLKKFDWIIASAIVLLTALGLVIIYSTTLDTGGFNRAEKQLLSFLLGLVVFIAFALIDYRIFKSYAIPLFIVLILSLVAVRLFGPVTRGARSWFDLGFYQLQPSELGKFIIIVLLAKYFSDHMKDRKRLKSVLLSAAYVAVPTLLIFIEPDFGQSIIYGVVWLGMLLASGIRARHVLLLVGVALLVGVLVYSFVLKGYQKDRLNVFLNRQQSTNAETQKADLGARYNVRQSEIAIGSGGIMGKGLGQGTQSQLNFLPEQQTDFVFAAISEELGFAGSFFLLTLFFVLLVRIVWVAKVARDDFGMFIAIGVASVFLVQLVVNVGMNLGLMPVTGIPLPLVSYGGSSILVSLALLGIVESVYIRHRVINFR